MTNADRLEAPSRRLVLLGASNLIRGISTAVGLSRQIWAEPLDVMAASGHGRSYGLSETRVLMRGLPGILSCGIWKALDERPQLTTTTLLTDIGNDILYDVSVEQIASWVEQCLQRLDANSERIVMTQLPLETLSEMNRRKFLMLRSILFPRSRLRFEDAFRRAKKLNHKVLLLADRYNATVIKPCAHWYGFDPIHVRKRFLPEAWQEITSSWRDERVSCDYSPSLRRWLVLRCLRPERRSLFGVVQCKTQPAWRFSNGTRISFY